MDNEKIIKKKKKTKTNKEQQTKIYIFNKHSDFIDRMSTDACLSQQLRALRIFVQATRMMVMENEVSMHH